ncbi:DAK2 domain-containing protein [Alicyclobacillus sp. TC]|uniref:DAK2 domain-containing protein n=1 Tax=Alicyclobacillus sp. TC TaxID=2606450 RepID=UPI0019334512|nr:DAK2 domain-containing protein [Alicyclobacillus sp. TC]QRF23772.1 DAK2 domain-containing protein [Alicyclobacillus sp. TC]
MANPSFLLSSHQWQILLGAAHAELSLHEEEINALNVFPVPDGDTGTNMNLTFTAGIKALHGKSFQTCAEVSKIFAEGLLMGARGNSGVILSQLFRGFSQVDVTAFSVNQFAKAFFEGVQIAYRAVSKPVEGTILSVARDVAQAAQKEARQENADWTSLFAVIVESAKQSLAATPQQLPVLKQAGVVDSGAQGLVYILAGMADAVSRWNKDQASPQYTETDTFNPSKLEQKSFYPAENVENISSDTIHELVESHRHYGYCTEALIRIEAGDVDRAGESLRHQLLAEGGDSLVLVTSPPYLRMHVHTLHPGQALEVALQFGPLVQIKIENMTEQNAHLHQVEQDSRPYPAAQDSTEEVQNIDQMAIVAAINGEGFRRVYESLGVTVLVGQEPLANPSIEDWSKAIEASGAEQVILLPNHKNVLLSAEQAAQLMTKANKRVSVVPTRTPVHGIAALLAFSPHLGFDENNLAMQRAVSQCRVGMVAKASRDSVYQNREVRAGQFLALLEDELLNVLPDANDALVYLLKELVQPDSELITVYTGSAASTSDLSLLRQQIVALTEIEVEFQEGGQSVFDYFITVE